MTAQPIGLGKKDTIDDDTSMVLAIDTSSLENMTQWLHRTRLLALDCRIA